MVLSPPFCLRLSRKMVSRKVRPETSRMSVWNSVNPLKLSEIALETAESVFRRLRPLRRAEALSFASCSNYSTNVASELRAMGGAALGFAAAVFAFPDPVPFGAMDPADLGKRARNAKRTRHSRRQTAAGSPEVCPGRTRPVTLEGATGCNRTSKSCIDWYRCAHTDRDAATNGARTLGGVGTQPNATRP